MYPEGAYCVWSPAMRSSVGTSGEVERSSRNWRASSARLRSRAEDGDVGIGSADAYGDSRMPEAFALEGPVITVGLRIGQRSALRPERRHDILAGSQLVHSPVGRRLDPEEFLAGQLSEGAHN